MKEIRVAYLNFWEDWNEYDNVFSHILGYKYRVVLDYENPDIVINAGKTHNYPNAISIFFAGEAEWDKGENDVGFVGFSMKSCNYFRFPLYLSDIYDNVRDGNTTMNHFFSERDYGQEYLNRKFACFVVTNKKNPIRNEIFHRLSDYKRVDSYGKAFNNMGETLKHNTSSGAAWKREKLALLKDYKFVIAAENTDVLNPLFMIKGLRKFDWLKHNVPFSILSKSGYVTEKIIHAYMGPSVPLFYGSPDIEDDFNLNSMLNYREKDGIENFIKNVIEVDQDDQRYLKLLNCQKIIRNNLLDGGFSKFICYFDSIFRKYKVL